MAFDLYKNTQIGDVTTYVRPFQTISYGPLGGPNTMIISEEQILVLPDASEVHVPITGQLNATITDPTATFNIVDPITGEITGTKTFAELKIEMYSLYLYLAGLRDQALLNDKVIS